MPPSATSSQPRCAAGTVSAIRVKAIGSRPPAEAPIRKHIARFHSNDGIAPQMAVPINISADSRMAARRPWRSAMRPHSTEPTVVPVSATSASRPALCLLMPYSPVSPGITNPSVAGFCTSTVSAITSTSTSFQCSRFSDAPSATWNSSGAPPALPAFASRGSMPQAASSRPNGIRPMPVSMVASISMPAIW